MFHKKQREAEHCLQRGSWIQGSVRHVIPRIEIEITNLNPRIEAGDVKEAVRDFFEQESEIELTVSLTKFVLLEEEKALKLLKAAHIKIRWVSYKVRRKKKLDQCYRCLGFGHIAADCRGPDRSRCCWKCGAEGHTAGFCSRQPRCYLSAAMEEKPRNDHIPGSMRCATFEEAAPNRKPQEGRHGEEIWRSEFRKIDEEARRRG